MDLFMGEAIIVYDAQLLSEHVWCPMYVTSSCCVSGSNVVDLSAPQNSLLATEPQVLHY